MMELKTIVARASALGAVSLSLIASAPSSQPYPRMPLSLSHMTLGYVYFNRPNASLAEHNADLKACLTDALQTWSADAEINRGGAGNSYGMIGGLVAGGLAAAANRGTASSALENCMVVRGWRVVLLPQAEGETLAASSDAEVAAKLAAWIGVAEPHGRVFRVWNNDAVDAAVERWSLRPPHLNDGFIALKLINTDLKAVNAEDPQPPKMLGSRAKSMPRDKTWPSGRLTQDQLTTLPPGSAILIMGMLGGITGVELERVGTDPNERPGSSDGLPDLIRAYGKFGAFVIPAGRWRMYALTKGMLSINMCLGSPAFEAKQGDVLFGGSFDTGGRALGPDMNLNPARAWLGSTKYAGQLKPVQWANGSRGKCGNSSIYAIEFPDAPFEPDYSWGSRLAKP